MFENEFQMLFYKSISSYFKDYLENPNTTLHFANKALMAQIRNFLETLFLSKNPFPAVLVCGFDFYKILEIGLKYFEAILKKL
jgi:hypothetical protein